jgi:ribonucleoside-diphosphate reductase beta chain
MQNLQKKSNLFVEQKAYKPFVYPWAYDAYKTQNQMHWLPEEVPMGDDVNDWKNKMTEPEKFLCNQIFKFFTQADVDVASNYSEKYLSVFKNNEIKMMLSAFNNMESIHVDSYSHLITTLGMSDDIYAEFLNYKEMVAKHEYTKSFEVDTLEHIALTLAGFGAFTEGLQLFASFAILLNFQRFGKMKGMGQIIAFSAKDEILHYTNIIKLFHTLIEENPELWTEELRKQLYEMCNKVVYFEDAFVDLAFGIEGAVQGMKKEDIKQYIRYIADQRLVGLKLKPIYLVENNPLPWMDYILSGKEHVNFFENRVTEYMKGTTTGTWENAFAIHDKK